jgi:hypothetical protein
VEDHILVVYLNRKEFLPNLYVMTGKTFILMGVMHMEYVEHYKIYGALYILFHTFIALVM